MSIEGFNRQERKKRQARHKYIELLGDLCVLGGLILKSI
jgi:hypothetical protein